MLVPWPGPRRKSRRPAGRLEEWAPSLLKSRLYGQLLVDIIIGDIAPGQRLDEKALAGRYGRDGGGLAGVREALARLALEGLVVRRARVGTMVAPLDPDDAREAFLARALIEIECAGLAARHAAPAEAAAIRATLDRGEAAIKKTTAAPWPPWTRPSMSRWPAPATIALWPNW